VPIDLAACVRALAKPGNRLYSWRFLKALKDRILRREGAAAVAKLGRIRSVYEFDDAYVAPFFGFGTADNYYATQSSVNFLPNIRVPALVIQAVDDPMIPFDIFADPRVTANPQVQVLPVPHGGHLGFISGSAPHFWLDRTILEWLQAH
jgi:hypothetical protein